jgi:archaellum component FlaC
MSNENLNNKIIPTSYEQLEQFASQVANDLEQIQQENDYFTKLFEKKASELELLKSDIARLESNLIFLEVREQNAIDSNCLADSSVLSDIRSQIEDLKTQIANLKTVLSHNEIIYALATNTPNARVLGIAPYVVSPHTLKGIAVRKEKEMHDNNKFKLPVLFGSSTIATSIFLICLSTGAIKDKAAQWALGALSMSGIVGAAGMKVNERLKLNRHLSQYQDRKPIKTPVIQSSRAKK